MSKNLFNTVQYKRPNSNNFDLSHDNKLSAKMGVLTPVLVQECIPGDKWRVGTEALLRFAPMLAPVMHKVNVYVHYFFVPNRIIWPNWEKFITGGQNPDATIIPPYLTGDEADPLFINPSSLGDYLGLPLVPDSGPSLRGLPEPVSALPFAAYQRIFHEYYRDQNLSPLPEDPPQLTDGRQTPNNAWTSLRRRAWMHDYFTSALPFAQKGEPVTIPIALPDMAPVKYASDGTVVAGIWRDRVSDLPIDNVVSGGFTTDGFGVTQLNDGTGTFASNYDPGDTLYTDLQGIGLEGTINDLRTAFRLQEWLEKNARAGSRYVESILAHFGVRSSDKRLQRPEYLGGTQQPMVISEVLQTSETTEDGTPQANMAGHGISVGAGRGFSYYCEEHGYIIGIMSVMPTTAYYQGIPRHFSKFDRMLYFWPEFANLGEQEIKNKELYFDPAQTDEQWNGTFGYTPRYSEYKYAPAQVHGEFRTFLEYWHLGRNFDSIPALNDAFITCDPSTRIFPVTDNSVDHLYCHILHRINVRRLMPKYGTPMF